ncbi:hypothetical protein [Microbacterium sp. ZOR0019]|uniref:hypothetical protein n=1 Tax=Microbacterium sp. ZOR0019 TaxID=1339233 RepID=UPI00064762CD|nr:hypothetical protein [Microbacterium sp. ZOR0019]
MSTTTADAEQKVYEHEGTLWRPKSGCTSTFDDLLTAQRRWFEIFHETDWNPWREKELQPEVEWAEKVMGEWERAEPDHRPMTKRRVGAINAAITRRVRAARRADEARWEEAKASYDPERERARYALLEQQCIAVCQRKETVELKGGTRFPGMAPDRRAQQVAELEAKVANRTREIARLECIVGDPETVIDEGGKLPRDRRKWNIICYGILRRRWIEERRETVAELRQTRASTKDRKEKASIDAQLWSAERRLNVLLAVPRLETEDTCADCYTPQYQHDYGDVFETSPCPAWPLNAARWERVREILRGAQERIDATKPEQPKPQPLATLPGNLPIAEVIERLSKLQQEHPDAVVKRGRANRWGLWPKEQ